MKMSNIKRCHNVAATFVWQHFPPLSLKVATQRCGNTSGQHSCNFPGLRYHNFHSMLWKRCYNLKLLAGYVQLVGWVNMYVLMDDETNKYGILVVIAKIHLFS